MRSFKERLQRLEHLEATYRAAGFILDDREPGKFSILWDDEKLTQILLKVRRESQSLTLLLEVIETFWHKYFGLEETRGVGKIIVYTLYHLPAFEKSTSYFFSLPMPDVAGKPKEDQSQMSRPPVISQDEIQPLVASSMDWPETINCNPLDQIERDDQIRISEVGHSFASDNVQDQNLMDALQQQAKSSFYHKIRDLIKQATSEGRDRSGASASASDTKRDSVYNVRYKKLAGITLYMMLVCLRRAVKTPVQFYKAFTKPRFSMNYASLVPYAVKLNIQPPAGSFNRHLSTELIKGDRIFTAAIGLVLYNYKEASSKRYNEKENFTGLLEATCLLHTRGNGMALYQMVLTAVDCTGASLQDILSSFAYAATERGIDAILRFRKHLVEVKCGTKLIYWSRLISDAFHCDLHHDHDRVLAYSLAYFLDKMIIPKKGTGLLNSLWISKCTTAQKRTGKEIAMRALRKYGSGKRAHGMAGEVYPGEISAQVDEEVPGPSRARRTSEGTDEYGELLNELCKVLIK